MPITDPRPTYLIRWKNPPPGALFIVPKQLIAGGGGSGELRAGDTLQVYDDRLFRGEFRACERDGTGIERVELRELAPAAKAEIAAELGAKLGLAPVSSSTTEAPPASTSTPTK
jgi:hypothetical protein